MFIFVIMVIAFLMIASGMTWTYWGIFAGFCCIGFWFDAWYQKRKVMLFLGEFLRIETTAMNNERSIIFTELEKWLEAQKGKESKYWSYDERI